MALTGSLVALAGAASPFVRLRPNRLVEGVAHSLASAGPYAWGVALALALALVAAFTPQRHVRRAAVIAAPALLLASIGWGLGEASVTLLEGQLPVARVSIGTGAWVLMAGAAVLGVAAHHVEPPAPLMTRLSLVGGALVALAALPWGGLRSLSLAREFSVRSATFWPLVGSHVGLAFASLAAAVVIGVPLGMWATRNARVRAVVLGVTGAIQTVPSLALLGLLVVPLSALGVAFPVLRELGIRGIGATPGLIALTLYALLPIVRGTYVGLSGVEPGALDAGRGMGMSPWQLLTRVELPLAVPLLLDGVRTAAVLVIGITTLTVFAGARNLGVLVFEGLGQFAPDLILLGALPTIALAVAADALFGWLAAMLTPKGVRA